MVVRVTEKSEESENDAPDFEDVVDAGNAGERLREEGTEPPVEEALTPPALSRAIFATAGD